MCIRRMKQPLFIKVMHNLQERNDVMHVIDSGLTLYSLYLNIATVL